MRWLLYMCRWKSLPVNGFMNYHHIWVTFRGRFDLVKCIMNWFVQNSLVVSYSYHLLPFFSWTPHCCSLFEIAWRAIILELSLRYWTFFQRNASITEIAAVHIKRLSRCCKSVRVAVGFVLSDGYLWPLCLQDITWYYQLSIQTSYKCKRAICVQNVYVVLKLTLIVLRLPILSRCRMLVNHQTFWLSCVGCVHII